MLINDELFDVSDWQDVYLVFWRWLYENKPVVFGRVLKHETNWKYPIIATKSELTTLVKEEQSVAGKFKRLSDGILFSKVKGETEENPLYVHVNQSAKFFINRIQEAMLLSEMNEESVAIELKPKKV